MLPLHELTESLAVLLGGSTKFKPIGARSIEALVGQTYFLATAWSRSLRICDACVEP